MSNTKRVSEVLAEAQNGEDWSAQDLVESTNQGEEAQ